MVSNNVSYFSQEGNLTFQVLTNPGILENWGLVVGFIVIIIAFMALQTVQLIHNRKMSRFKYLKKNSQTLSEIEDLNELYPITKKHLAQITRSIAKHYIKSASPSDNQVGRQMMEAAYKLKKGHQLSSDDQKLLKECWSATLSQLLLIN